jgi:hypothetical protein
MIAASPVSGVACPHPPLAQFHVSALAQFPSALAVNVLASVEEDVYRNGAGGDQMVVSVLALISELPTKYGVIVNVKLDDEAVGVTVNGSPDDPLVIVSRPLLLASVTVWLPSNVAPVIVTVQVLDATRRLPLAQPEKAIVAAELVYP